MQRAWSQVRAGSATNLSKGQQERQALSLAPTPGTHWFGFVSASQLSTFPVDMRSLFSEYLGTDA